MASFLVTCPQCHAMVAKDMPCPDCGQSEANATDGFEDTGMLQEFARREGVHKRNYAIFMGLMLATGLVGVVTAFMWWRFIYHGSILAFFAIVLLTVFTAALGVALRYCRKWFPVELHCPSCNVRLDQLGLSGKICPGCQTRLK